MRRAPEDVALVGLDDLAWTELVRPRLTLVAQPVAELGATAAWLLLDRIGRYAPVEPRHELLARLLGVRESR